MSLYAKKKMHAMTCFFKRKFCKIKQIFEMLFLESGLIKVAETPTPQNLAGCRYPALESCRETEC